MTSHIFRQPSQILGFLIIIVVTKTLTPSHTFAVTSLTMENVKKPLNVISLGQTTGGDIFRLVTISHKIYLLIFSKLESWKVIKLSGW